MDPGDAQLVEMIGSMTPGRVLDCGEACAERLAAAAAHKRALETWRDLGSLPGNADACAREVFQLLGDRTEGKLALVEHLIGKLGDNGYTAYAEDEEDFALTVSRVQHLDICNYNWRENIRIVLKEIAAGQRLFEWHVPEGFNAHGDCPDRIPQLRELMAAIAAWAEGTTGRAGQWGQERCLQRAQDGYCGTAQEALVARRQHSRTTGTEEEDPAAGTPNVWLSSTPDVSHER